MQLLRSQGGLGRRGLRGARSGVLCGGASPHTLRQRGRQRVPVAPPPRSLQLRGVWAAAPGAAGVRPPVACLPQAGGPPPLQLQALPPPPRQQLCLRGRAPQDGKAGQRVARQRVHRACAAGVGRVLLLAAAPAAAAAAGGGAGVQRQVGAASCTAAAAPSAAAAGGTAAPPGQRQHGIRGRRASQLYLLLPHGSASA